MFQGPATNVPPRPESIRFNPPPNWPAPPPGWTPPTGWEPDPSWPPPPGGWQLWIADSVPAGPVQDAGAGVGTRTSRRRTKRTIWPVIAAASLASALAGVGLGYFIRPATSVSKPVAAIASASVPGSSVPSHPQVSPTVAASNSSRDGISPGPVPTSSGSPIASTSSGSSSDNYPSWLCPKVATDLDNAQSYISDDDGTDLFYAANDVVNAIQGATDSVQLSGTPLSTDSLALEADANAMSNGDPNNAEADYNAVMSDCGQ